MGRLQAVSPALLGASLAGALALLGLALLGCDSASQAPPPPPTSRINAVSAAPASSASAPATASVAAPTPAKPRKLCLGQEERDAPETLSDARAAEGAKPPPPLRYGEGKWVWLNVWAAWCEPCKEEMPMLLEWRDKLRAAGVALELVFVSIDDDEREMDRFLGSQPEKGVRTSYWLREEARESWFESIGLDDTPQLPVHALVTPKGKLSCLIEGAVESGDYEPLKAYFSKS
jgi:thiol-disulfide isomerase/thioredoxin